MFKCPEQDTEHAELREQLFKCPEQDTEHAEL